METRSENSAPNRIAMSFPKIEIESLWCPWRVEYYEREHGSGEDFLLHAANSKEDAKHLVVDRRATAFLIMNKYPYSCGHLMSVPNRKVADLSDLGKEEIADMWDLCILAQQLLRKVVRAQGFNIGFNIGKAGGAGVHDHLHLHIVPRWEGDANFMPVLGHTRILPQALEPLYQQLVSTKTSISPA